VKKVVFNTQGNRKVIRFSLCNFLHYQKSPLSAQPEQAAEMAKPIPSMSLDMDIRALSVILLTLLKFH